MIQNSFGINICVSSTSVVWILLPVYVVWTGPVFWVGDTWTLVCKCYLNLCSIIVCGMYVRTVDASRLPNRSPAGPFPRGRLPRLCPETRRPWTCPGFYFDNRRRRGEAFSMLRTVLCRGGPLSFPPLYFLRTREEERWVTCMVGICGLWCFVLYLV